MLAFIYGTDHYRISQKLKDLKDGFIQKRDKSGLNIVNLNGDKLELDHLKQEVMTVPFLAEKKMIVVKNIFSQPAKALKPLAEFLESIKELDNVLVFVDFFDPEEIKYRGNKIHLKNPLFSLLTKQEFCWNLMLMKNYQVETWLADYVKQQDIHISQTTLKQLVALVGTDLYSLTNELVKLQAYANSQEITIDDVNLLVHAQYEDNIFSLIDAIANQRTDQALELFKKQILYGSHPLMILTLLSRQFKILIRIKTGASSATDLGVHPFVFQKANTQAKNFSLDQLMNLNNRLMDMEVQLKSGFNNEELLFDLFIAKQD